MRKFVVFVVLILSIFILNSSARVVYSQGLDCICPDSSWLYSSISEDCVRETLCAGLPCTLHEPCTYPLATAPACFLPGTEIGTKSGVTVIEKVEVGDWVKSFEGGKIVESQVSSVFERERDFYYALKAGKYEVKASAEHPFLMWDNSYKEIQYLVPGDKVFVEEDGEMVIKSVIFNKRIEEKTKVYNLSVDNTHTYFANGFAVHNKGGGGACPWTPVDCPAGTTADFSQPISQANGGAQCYKTTGCPAIGSAQLLLPFPYPTFMEWCANQENYLQQYTCVPIVDPNEPKGILNSATCTVSSGWTCDPNDYNQSLRVDLYADGAGWGLGTFLGNTIADIYRPDVEAAGVCGGTGNHGFNFNTPNNLIDGTSHDIYAFAINILAGANNPQLTSSPMTISCTLPPPTNLAASCVGNVASFSWLPPATGNVDHYAIRVNDQTTGWDGSCTSPDACADVFANIYSQAAVTGRTYSWWIHSVSEAGGWSVPVYGTDFTCAVPNSPPTYDSMTVKNSESTNVAYDSGNRLHICKNDFQNATAPRQAIFTFALMDVDGGADITSASMRWNGVVTPLGMGTIIGNTRYATATIDYTGTNNPNTYPVYVSVTDASGATSGYVDTTYLWKVWDCSVPVSESIYDGSTGQACNTTGFSVPAGPSMGYTGIIYGNMSGGANGTTSLVWGDSYLPFVNGGDVANPEGDLQASSRFTRLIDLGVGTTICPVATQFDTATTVSAYSTNPSLKVDLSYTLDQEGWYQARGMNLKSRTEISWGVPIAAGSALSVDNLSIGVSNNGIVASNSFRNINGNTSGIYGINKNWYINRNVLDLKKYSYQIMYDNYFTKLGEGVTNVTVINTGSTGVLFVTGNINIENDVVVAANRYLMVVASGSINIGVGASRVDGIFIANGGIGVTGSSDNQLIINGVLHAANNSDIKLTRRFAISATNNLTPAIIVNYRPDLLFALPGKLNKVLSGWKEY